MSKQNLKILKYEFNIEQASKDEGQILDLPANATILDINSQNGIPMIWALVDPDEKEKINWTLKVFGTGWDIPADMIDRDYIKTLHLNGYVWHCFQQYKK